MNKRNFVCEADYPVVEVSGGKIRGYFLNGLFYFRGIPYARADRFMPPEPVEPWEGVRPAYTYGPNAPVTNRPQINRFDPAFQFRYWPESEKCLTLNIWTPEINGGAKRPVMVWIHGGSLAFGSATELVGYEADGICRDEDIVVVSVNHRLNLLGYMNLSEYGERYASTGTNGMLDLVEALRWIRQNIAGFGGDPGNVTIVGHSGGGAKVRTLMQMPAAEELFHKAIIHSGIRYNDDRFRPAEIMRHDSAATAFAIVKELGLDKNSIEQIEKIPYSRIAAAYRKVDPELRAAGINSIWSPIPDAHFPGDYTAVGLSDKAKNTPMIVGCTFGEMDLDRGVFYDRGMSAEELDKALKSYYGDGFAALKDMYMQSFPYKDAIDLLYLDSTYRIGSTDYLTLREDTGNAPSYMFMLTYDFKIFGGFPAWHGSDLPFLFKSYDRIPVYNEPVAEKIGELFSAYIGAFVRSGEPGVALAPKWHRFTRANNETMIFDRECFVSDQISYDMMYIHNRMCPAFAPNFASEADDA